MDNLWKKESSGSGVGAWYVDLFPFEQGVESIGEEIMVKQFQKMTTPTAKDNEFSTKLRQRGNEFFKAKNWAKAMDLYNESLCYAEIGTEDVGLSYISRSSAFYQVKEYEKALIDIELAQKANVPGRLLPTLEYRKQKCHELMQQIQTPDVPRELKLIYEANENYRCLADVVEIKYNEEFGRHLVAKSDIPAGKIVLMEKEFITAKDNERIVCCTCFQKNQNFIACDHCPFAVFCDRDCMDKNRWHKWECGSSVIQMEFSIKFNVRAVLLAIASFESVDRLMEFVDSALREDPETIPTSTHDPASDYHFFFKLKKFSHTLEDILTVYKYFSCIKLCPKIMAHFDTEEKTRFLMHLLVHHHLITRSNGIEETNYKSMTEVISTVNHSVGNIFSMTNHSCTPNLTSNCVGDLCICETIRFIPEGEQLCISYLDILQCKASTEERQRELKANWGFDCKCEKCQATDNVNARLLRDPHLKFILENNEDEQKHPEMMEECLHFLNENGRLPWSNEIFVISTIFAFLLQWNVYKALNDPFS